MSLGSLSMSTFKELRMVLESSLTEIFRVTVSDIMDNVEGSLSEHQRKMQRIEFENADLRRMLFQRNNSESPPADTGDNEEVMTYTSCTMTSHNTFSSDEESSRRKHKDRMRESNRPKHYPITFEEITVDPGHNFKTEPGPESSHAMDLPKSPAPVQLTRRSMKPGAPGGAHGGSDVTDGSHYTHTPQPPSSDLHQDCGGGREEEAGLPVIVKVYSIKAETNGLHDEHRTADAAACSTDTAAPVPLPESGRLAHPRPLGRGTGGLKAGAEGSDVNNYSCAYCGKCFNKRSLLTVHLHSHTREQPYCGVCGKTFSNTGHLHVHKHIHTGERPYSCSLCTKTFSRSFSKTRHLHIHTGERPYCCSLCTKTFSRASHLKRHALVHTREGQAGAVREEDSNP